MVSGLTMAVGRASILIGSEGGLLLRAPTHIQEPTAISQALKSTKLCWETDAIEVLQFPFEVNRSTPKLVRFSIDSPNPAPSPVGVPGVS